jgi:hypothetical protein
MTRRGPCRARSLGDLYASLCTSDASESCTTTPAIGSTGASHGRRSSTLIRLDADIFREVTMLAFGLGAALPLAALGLLSHEALMRWRTHLLAGGTRAKVLFAIVIVLIGVFVLTDLDKHIEALAVDHSPQWLTDVSTRF